MMRAEFWHGHHQPADGHAGSNVRDYEHPFPLQQTSSPEPEPFGQLHPRGFLTRQQFSSLPGCRFWRHIRSLYSEGHTESKMAVLDRNSA
jgi:hypothetical protein